LDRPKSKIIECEKTHGGEKCDCLFCLCKCPVCGTKEISVTFRPEWEFKNTTEDKITITRQGDLIRVDCPKCGELETDDNFFAESGPDLSNLRKFFNEALGLPAPAYLKHSDGGKISLKLGR
jgi:hypothetical protein